MKTGYLDSGWGNYSNVGSANRTEQSFVLTEEERRTIIQVSDLDSSFIDA